MGKFILKRLTMSIITIWLIITITFVLMKSIPGDPFAKEGKMPPQIYENLLRSYGLDKPEFEQYKIYLTNVLKFNLGTSMKMQNETVNQYIKRGAPVSARLGVQAFVLSLIFGCALGIIAALYQNKWPDYLAMVIAIIGISVPSFVLGTSMIQFIARKAKWLPIGGWGTFNHTILPSIALSLMPMASTARLMRSSMLEVLGQDYIKTARSKGIGNFSVIIGHGVRNAILPIVSQMGTTITNLLTGSFIIEKIFGVPGLGTSFIDSIINRDYTLIMGTTIFYSTILIGMLLIVDVLYILIDPRIKLTGGEK